MQFACSPSPVLFCATIQNPILSTWRPSQNAVYLAEMSPTALSLEHQTSKNFNSYVSLKHCYSSICVFVGKEQSQILSLALRKPCIFISWLLVCSSFLPTDDDDRFWSGKTLLSGAWRCEADVFLDTVKGTQPSK